MVITCDVKYQYHTDGAILQRHHILMRVSPTLTRHGVHDVDTDDYARF